jgi:hypothetical protein
VIEECPEFAEATRRFAAFLREQGWPERIQWVSEGNVERPSAAEITVYLTGDDDGAEEAERVFERGRQARLGVMLDAICTWGEATCAVVSYPRDALQAEQEWYPAPGLKLRAALPRLAGTVRWAAC